MPLPPSIQTTTVTFGSQVSNLGSGAIISATVRGDRPVVHAATGVTLNGLLSDDLKSDPGQPLSFAVAAVDQDGFIDDRGQSIKFWKYAISGSIVLGNTKVPFNRSFQVLAGQDSIELALVPDSPTTGPVSAPTADVLSIGGLTGIVEIDELAQLLGVGQGGGGGPVDWDDVQDKPTEFPPAPHTSAKVVDFTEAVQDAVGAMLVSGANVTLTYDDTAGTLQVTAAAGADAEATRDAIGAALVGVQGVGVAVNDAGDTITLSITGVTISQVTGLSTALAAKADLSGPGNTVPQLQLPAHLTPAALADSIGQASTADRARVNHTGTQLAATISDFTEAAQDAVAAMLTSGANVILSYDDASNTLQVTAAGGDAEVMRDTIGAALVGVNGVGVTVNDAADTITLSITGVTVAQVTGLQAALDGKPSTTTVQALIDTTVAVKASTLRQLATVWGKYYNRGAPYAFASRIANFDAQRKRLFVHNIGTVTIQVAPKNTNNLDFNNPATWPTTLAPGEWLITTNTLTHFYRLNVSTDPAAEIHVYTEAVSA